MRGRAVNQTGQKIPIFEHDQKQQSLPDSHQAKNGALLVKPAENAFPDEDQKAGSSGNTTNLGQGKENKKASAED